MMLLPLQRWGSWSSTWRSEIALSESQAGDDEYVTCSWSIAAKKWPVSQSTVNWGQLIQSVLAVIWRGALVPRIKVRGIGPKIDLLRLL